MPVFMSLPVMRKLTYQPLPPPPSPDEEPIKSVRIVEDDDADEGPEIRGVAYYERKRRISYWLKIVLAVIFIKIMVLQACWYAMEWRRAHPGRLRHHRNGYGHFEPHPRPMNEWSEWAGHGHAAEWSNANPLYPHDAPLRPHPAGHYHRHHFILPAGNPSPLDSAHHRRLRILLVRVFPHVEVSPELMQKLGERMKRAMERGENWRHFVRRVEGMMRERGHVPHRAAVDHEQEQEHEDNIEHEDDAPEQEKPEAPSPAQTEDHPMDKEHAPEDAAHTAAAPQSA